MTRVYQILAIARTEYRLQWRRRGLLVMTLAMLVVSGVSTILLKNQMGTRDVLADHAGASTVGLISFTLLPVSAVLAMVMPFVMVDAVPNDRHLGIFELLTTLPMSRTMYLAGKLLGVMLSVFFRHLHYFYYHSGFVVDSNWLFQRCELL
ncbi:MAG TPA: hypothetical protein VHP83_19250 [Aggregatilineaceae bacterium]|nr:hypothetical protein [Aggregatilineaceae bacterium]